VGDRFTYSRFFQEDFPLLTSLSFERVIGIHCWAPLDLGASGMQPFDFSSSRTVRPCTTCEDRWTGQRRTTWSTVCSSAPHSQAAEEVIPHLCRQEGKRPTPVRNHPGELLMNDQEDRNRKQHVTWT